MAKTSLLIGLMTLGFASISPGQIRPMPPDPYDPQQATQTSAAPQAALPASNDYPAAEVQAVPPARARAAAAREAMYNAQSAVHRVVDQLKEDFEYSAELSNALRSEKQAYERFTTSRDRVLRHVASQAEHRTLKNLCKDLNDRLFNLKSKSAANKAEIIATAQLKLAYATKISDMESDALLADSAAQDAKTQLVSASAKVTDLRAAFRRSVKRDQTFVAARKEMDEAKVVKAGATAFLDGAVEARNIAMTYAYSLHRRDPYTYRYAGSYGYPYDSVISSIGYGTSYNPMYRAFPWR